MSSLETNFLKFPSMIPTLQLIPETGKIQQGHAMFFLLYSPTIIRVAHHYHINLKTVASSNFLKTGITERGYRNLTADEYQVSSAAILGGY
jgi:hypothetical protein